ncbi:MAG: AAA family ATPase [Chthoniobacteraceae bacterium]
METFAAFVPPLLIERLARERPPFGQPFASEFEGAVLFTDITGFTGMTERLEASGPDGVERLSVQLNAYFSRLIRIVEEHGGMVVKFAGDALVAVWPADGTTVGDAARSAAGCAWEIVTTLDGQEPETRTSLSIKASIGTGRVVHAILGGVGGRWVSMIGGEATEGARAAMRECTPGAVTLPVAAIESAGSAVEVDSVRDGFGRVRAVRPADVRAPRKLDAALAEEAWLRAHIPTAVLDRIAAGHTGWMAEFRRVTILFLHVPDFELRHRGDLEAVQRAVTAVQAEIARCGGAIDDTGEDHSGLVVLAAFGLPGATHEDDATRAVRAALNIGATLRSAVGVSTGRVFCGAIGSRSLRSYLMVGDAMNSGERLMRLAGQEALCDGATRRSASRHLHFDFLRRETLRGRQGSVEIFRPTQRRPLPLFSAEMIGRDGERQLLHEKIASLAGGGPGGAVLIEGEAGIGKSTLLAELRTAALAGGVPFFQGGADAIDAASTYHAWQTVFQEVIGIHPEMDPAARAALLCGTLAADKDGGLQLAPLLNPIFGTDLPENEITGAMSAQPRSEAVTRMLVRLVGQAAGAVPLVIAIEDCHWLDSASLALALTLIRSVPRLLLVMATRPPPKDASGTWAALREAAGSDHLHLGPLSHDEVALLAGRRLGAARIDSVLGRFVAERSGGNPFFSEEICLALRDGGHVSFEEDRCRLAAGDADSGVLNLPDTVQGVLSARIDRLSARERLVMKVASVNGRMFSHRMLNAVHPVEADRPHLQDCMRRLVSLDFATALDAAEGGAFEFKHSIVQEVAYGQLTFSQRQELHRRLAEWMEREEHSDVALLARHWDEAAVPERAIHYLTRAGDEAIRRFANREAAGFLTRAIALSDSSGANIDRLTRGRWHRQLGEALFHLGQIELSRQNLCASTRILGWPIPNPWLLKRLSLPRAVVRQVACRLGLWRSRSIRRERRELMIEALNAYGLLGELAFFTNDLPASFYCLFHGANLAERLGDSPKLAELFSGITVVTGALWPRLGGHYKRLTERILDQHDAPVTRGYADQLLGIYLGGVGEAGEARRLLEEGSAIFRRYGNGRRLEESLLSIIYPHLHRGEYEQCAAPLDEMRCSAERRGDTQTLGWVRILRTQLLLALRGPQAALNAMGSDFITGLDELTCTALHASAAVAHWHLGDGKGAWRFGEIALQRCESRRPIAYVMLLYTSYVAEVFLGLLEQGGATAAERCALRELARRACAVMRQFARAFPVGRPRSAIWKGLWHWIRNDRTAARRHWDRALTAASRFGLLPDAALAHRQLARCDGGMHLTEAAAIRDGLKAGESAAIRALLGENVPAQRAREP